MLRRLFIIVSVVGLLLDMGADGRLGIHEEAVTLFQANYRHIEVRSSENNEFLSAAVGFTPSLSAIQTSLVHHLEVTSPFLHILSCTIPFHFRLFHPGSGGLPG
jgi:hypothetical protein